MPESTAPPAGPVEGGTTSSGPPGTPGADPAKSPPAWSSTLSDLVVNTVDSVKSKATVKVVTGLRVVVYGVVILAALLTAGFLLLIGVIRMWDVYLPLSPVGRRVWLGYVVFGGALFLAGSWFLARSRKAK